MHFHLPKPVHGWRAFVGEVGIIVIGVLIALGAEQIVETLNWREHARETETALKAEIQDSADAVAERIAVDECLRNQLVSLRSASQGTAPQSFTPPANKLRVLPDLYATPWRVWAQGGWETATASNILNRLPTERLYAYAQVYKAIEDMDGIVRRERELKSGLSPIVARTMTPEQSGDVLMALTSLDRARADMLVAGHDLLESAAVLGIHPKSPADHSVAAFISRYGVCRPNPK